MKYIQDLLDHFFNSKDHLEGLFLYMCGSVTITIVHIRYAREFIQGMKGTNKLFEAPEIILYLFCWLFPHVLMVDQFLTLKLSIEGWYFLGVLLLFGLTGRWGLEWIQSMRTGKSIEEIEKTTSSTTKTTETKTTND